jgi:hypothetical protein
MPLEKSQNGNGSSALGDPAPTTCYSLCRQSRVFFSGAVLPTKRHSQAMALVIITVIAQDLHKSISLS